MIKQYPQHIDNNKIFIIQRSEIEGRWDPHYNQPQYEKLLNKLESLPYELSSLKKQSSTIFSGITPKSGGDAYSDIPDAIPFIRSGDFSETNQINFSKLLHLKPEIHNGIMVSSQLKKNDLLFAIVGATIGKIGIYLYDREANINQAVCGVRLKENLNPYYVQAFYQTEIGQKLIERVKRPVARANLNLDEIGALPIPLVDESTQQEIINKLKEGIDKQQQKESDAKRLLCGIDIYLLDELGITIPKIENDLANRVFITNYRNIEGTRFDPYYIIYFEKDCQSTKFENVPLGRIAHIVKGTALTSKEVISGNIPVIAGGQTVPYHHNVSNFVGNVITVSASGAYAGFVWYHTTPIFATDCSVVYSKDETKFLTAYIYEVLRYLQAVIYRLQVGAAQPHVYPTDLMNIQIPCLPIEQQKSIVERTAILRQQAKDLHAEGKAILENAKKDIERMIMGESS